jgi:hypothetical protein
VHSQRSGPRPIITHNKEARHRPLSALLAHHTCPITRGSRTPHVSERLRVAIMPGLCGSEGCWWPRISGARLGPIRPGVRGQFRKAVGPGWALVGDAGYFKDPFAAHGISDAFRDAELLADSVLSADFDSYESLRDELSTPLFNVLDKIAGYQWDLDTLPGLHMDLSMAMRDEGKALRSLERTPATV